MTAATSVEDVLLYADTGINNTFSCSTLLYEIKCIKCSLPTSFNSI